MNVAKANEMKEEVGEVEKVIEFQFIPDPDYAKFDNCSNCIKCEQLFICEKNQFHRKVYNKAGLNDRVPGRWFRIEKTIRWITVKEFYELSDSFSQTEFAYRKRDIHPYMGHNFGNPNYKKKSDECFGCATCNLIDECKVMAEELGRTMFQYITGSVKEITREEIEKECPLPEDSSELLNLFSKSLSDDANDLGGWSN